MSGGEKPTAPVTLRLTKQAVLTGRITDERGQGLLAFVTLHQQAPNNSASFQRRGEPFFNDRTGEFRFAGLEAGRYYVEVTQALPDLYDAREKVYAAQFYPDKTGLQSAEPIDLTAGQEQRIEMQLRVVRGYEIHGRFPASSHPNSWLELSNEADAGPRLSLAESWDAQTGAFKISGVPSGSYRLHADANAGGKMIEPIPVTVDGADVDGILLEPPGRR